MMQPRDIDLKVSQTFWGALDQISETDVETAATEYDELLFISRTKIKAENNQMGLFLIYTSPHNK